MAAKKKVESFDDIYKDLAVDAEKIKTELEQGPQSWSTGSAVLDILTGIGGLPKGRIVECYGAPGTGKSTLYWSCAKEVQKEGKMVVLLDFERATVPIWAHKLGVNVTDKDLFLQVRPEVIPTAEAGFDVIYKILNSPLADKIGLIIWDSIATATSAIVHDKENVGDKVRMMSKASMLTEEVPKLAEKLEICGQGDITVGFVNQVRANMDAGLFGNPEKAAGSSKAFEHSASLRIYIQKMKTLTDDKAVNEFTGEVQKEAYGREIKMTIAKSRYGMEGRHARATFLRETGFDNVTSLVDFAIGRGDFKKVSPQKVEVPASLTSENKKFEGVRKSVKEYYYKDYEAYLKLRDYMVEAVNRSYKEKIENAPRPDEAFRESSGEIDLSDLG